MRDGEPADRDGSGWWIEVEADVLRCFVGARALEPAAIAARLGMPEAAVVSLLAQMAREGTIEIRLVAPRRSGSERQAAQRGPDARRRPRGRTGAQGVQPAR
jgi:hypothetical protein